MVINYQCARSLLLPSFYSQGREPVETIAVSLLPFSSNQESPTPIEPTHSQEGGALFRLSQYQSFQPHSRVQNLPPASSISLAEFLGEMLLGIPRGFVRMGNDAGNHPLVLLGTLALVLGGGFLLPQRASAFFNRGLLYVGAGVSGVFIGKGLEGGVHAWLQNDRAALKEASTNFGVGVLSLGLSIGGVKLGQKLGRTETGSLRWGVIGNLLHSTDEIAAALAIFRGVSQTQGSKN